MSQKPASQILDIINSLVQKNRLISGKFDLKEKVVSFQHPAELERILPLGISRQGLKDEELTSVCNQVIQYSVKTCHPHFYNQLYHGVDEFGLGATWLSEALNTNNHTFEVSPVFMVVEKAVLSYARQLFGWGDQGDGIFCPGGSLANMYGMMLARHARFPNFKSTGLFNSKPLVCFTSEESHYSIVKGANWLGFGVDNVCKVKTDSQGRMSLNDLEKCIQKARSTGKEPFFVNATAGSTVIGAYDDINQLAKICKKNQMWLHVDAAWGGSVIMSAKHRHLLAGVENADSIAWNPHKMLGAPLQASLFLTRHKGKLHETNSASATYLFQQDKFYDVTYDTGDKSVQCGRKVDGFKFWFMLKARGEDYLEDAVDKVLEVTQNMKDLVAKRDGFLPVPAFKDAQCANIGFWYVPPRLRGQPQTDEWWTEVAAVAPKIKERLTMEGSVLVGYQPLPYMGYRNFFRLVLHCCPIPTMEDMETVLSKIEEAGKDL